MTVRVCISVRGCALVCGVVCRCVGAFRCMQVCKGVQVVCDEFSEYLLEIRVQTSADFNTYPIRIFI